MMKSIKEKLKMNRVGCSFRIAPEVKQQFKSFCIENNTSMTTVFKKIITLVLEKRENINIKELFINQVNENTKTE